MTTETPLQSEREHGEHGNSTDEFFYTLKDRSLHSLQVKAFLDAAAADDVDLDRETLEDILDGLNEEGEATVISQPGFEEDDSNSVLTEDSVDGELNISALYSGGLDVDKPPRWTSQEVRYMLINLKERGMTSWIQEYVFKRQISIPDLLLAFSINLCEELRHKLPKTMLYFLRVALSRELSLRDKLPQYNTISDAITLIESSKRILILTGAGISVSCGIPDFRSRDGVYAMLKDENDYQLDDPQQMFDITYFRENPSTFFSFASQIYPTNFTPSPCHRFIKLVEDKGKLLRNYTQNIDTLETAAGVQRVLQCHGSFATATCLQCRRRVPGKEIEADILRRKVPLCSVCNVTEAPRQSQKKGKRKGRKKTSNKWDSEEEDESDEPEFPPGIMKPDITFFGEKLTDEFDRLLEEDRDKVDLLLVIGTSLKVAPVADILSHLPHSVPQILINKTPVRHINPDIVLLGNADDIVQYLCQEMSWEIPPPPPPPATTRLYPPRGNAKRLSSEALDYQEPRRVGQSHVWLFQGAEGGKWVQDIERISLSNQDLPASVESTARDDHIRKKARIN